MGRIRKELKEKEIEEGPKKPRKKLNCPLFQRCLEKKCEECDEG